MPDDEILDDLFHGCAFAAWLEQAAIEGGPPDGEATRRLAFRYYEEELARKRGRGIDRRPGVERHERETGGGG